MKILKTNGSGLWQSIKSSYISGGRKYFFHNLSCELRRGRYKECFGYEDTLWDRFLFSLGMFVMDPFGKFFFQHSKWQVKFTTNKVDMNHRQWLRHPMPWVRLRAKWMIRKLGG